MTGLATIADVEIITVSPAQNQSGTSMNLTDGELTSTAGSTASSVEAIAVEGDIVFADSVGATVEWITANRDDYEAGVVSLTSINSPTCPDGVRGVVEVSLGAFDGRNPGEVDCASTLEVPIDDVDAFTNGFTAITDLPIQV